MLGRVGSGAIRSNRWRIAALFAAAGLGALIFVAAPGSIELLKRGPAGDRNQDSSTPSWAQPCLRQLPDPSGRQLAFCARLNGRVVASETKSGDGETHLLVLGGFHVTLVELRPGSRRPPWGSRITAVGPLFSDSFGLRELRAAWVRRT